MKRTFLVKKDPTIEAQDNWLIMDYRQYAAWRETDEGKNREIVFGKFEACSEDDSIIFMECNEKVSKELKKDCHRKQYIRSRDAETPFQVMSYSTMTFQESEIYGEDVLEDTECNVEESVMQRIRANRMEFSRSAIRLFEGVQHVLPMLSENKKRMVVAICAEEEISSIEWARLKKDKWVNRSISCPEYVQSIYKMMNWNKECRYKIYGRLANSERGLVLVFDLASAVMFDPLPEEYFDKHTGKMKKRIVKYYPDEIRMKLGRSYSDYEALQQRSSFESLSGYMDTSGGAVPATVSEELAASISMQEQEKKRETLFGTIIGNGGDDDVRNNE